MIRLTEIISKAYKHQDENGIFFQHTDDGEKFYYTDAKCYQKRKATEEEKQNLLGKIII